MANTGTSVPTPTTISADESWYLHRDARRQLAPHCPLAANEKCPRYYLSQKHAAAAGVATQVLSEAVRVWIEGEWAASDAFSALEQSVATWFGHDGSLRGVDGFCPEVTARIFGLYCSSLRSFPDVATERMRHKVLEENKVSKSDPRWNWHVIEPRHYAECVEYSVYFDTRKGAGGAKKRTLAPSVRWAVLERDGRRCVYCGKTSNESPLHVDHKISVADGGTESLDNLVTACAECNLGKGSKSTV